MGGTAELKRAGSSNWAATSTLSFTSFTQRLRPPGSRRPRRTQRRRKFLLPRLLRLRLIRRRLKLPLPRLLRQKS